MHTAITIKVARSKLNDKTKGFKGRTEIMHMPNSNEILFGQVCTSLVYDKERFDLICAEPFFKKKALLAGCKTLIDGQRISHL